MEAGRVVAITPGASVQRAGKTLPLELKGVVEAGDTLLTDATGRVRILFADDSSMTIGSNTVLSLQTFAPGGKKPEVKAHLTKGLLRAITGTIVEQNPEGFSLTSPEATVGIRGTIISMLSANGRTTVYVENTTKQVYVNGVLVPAGQKITVPGDPLRPEPLLPQDRRDLGRALAFLGGPGTAAAAPEPSRQAEASAPTTLLAGNALPTPGTALGALPLATELAGSQLNLPTAIGGASVSGLLATSYTGPGSFSGTFAFSVDLNSGAISGGTMSGSGLVSSIDTLTANFTGGTGTANASGFSVSNFGGTGTFGSVALPLSPGTSTASSITGSSNLLTAPSGTSVPVNYAISGYDAGNGSGVFTKP